MTGIYCLAAESAGFYCLAAESAEIRTAKNAGKQLRTLGKQPAGFCEPQPACC